MAKQITQAKGLCLMWYKCEKCHKRERLWNSRPRVTPFMISCSEKDCDGNMMHEKWDLDQYAPNHRPNIGERIFVDLAEETYAKLLKEYVDEQWAMKGEHTIRLTFSTKEEAIAEFGGEWKFGQPHVITIKKEIA